MTLFALATLSLLAACTLETSDNGKLDGFWHLCTVDTLSTQGTQLLQNQHYYWAFQGKLLSVRDTDSPFSYNMRFAHQGDSLRVYDIYRNESQYTDSLLTSPDSLRPFGINQLQESFLILQLNSSHMTLQNKALRLKFRKM